MRPRGSPAVPPGGQDARWVGVVADSVERERNLSTPLGQFFGWIVESVGSGGLIQVVPGRLGGSGCLRTNLLGVAV